MRRVVALIAFTFAALISMAQDAAYAPSENPFQNEYEFSIGRVIQLRADVQGVRLDTVTLMPVEAVEAGRPVRCEVELVGTNLAERKVEIATVLLLEDATSKGLEGGRLQLEPFKVKAGKAFAQRLPVSVQGDALNRAAKVYVLVQMKF
ncbi:MAG TPA: hypothetical protein P5234_09840 [Thermoanaerobaculaceae bacterium]|nr:hypothetical protein [Thermoanaerobaculaceae bacterium]HRS16531.1 hypothetical protein [Thermoanaerobaculaceae bacterium]